MRALTLFLVLSFAAPACAQAHGSVTGTLTIERQPVALKYASAHMSDNAEKLPGRSRKLRILLCDRPVPSDALSGGEFPPVWDLANEGDVRGMLIELDPARPNTVSIVLLEKPTQEGRSLTTLSMSRTGMRLFKEWKLTSQSVSGALERTEEPSGSDEIATATFSVRFDAPITREPPITGDLKGAAAARSPQVAALHARLNAMANGDLAGIRAVSSKRANRRIDRMPPAAFDELKSRGKQIAAEQRKSLATVRRVIVRGDRAVVIISNKERATVVREGGKWKAHD